MRLIDLSLSFNMLPRHDLNFVFIYPLFFQEGPIEIKINLFQGVLAKMAVLKFHINI